MWTIALYGSDSYFEPNEKSEVLLSVIGQTDPMTNNNWIKFDVLGCPTHYEQRDNIKELNGVAYHTKGQKRVITLDFDYFIFPDDEHKKIALEQLLNKQFIYFYCGTYVFSSWQFHTSNSCLMVACYQSVESDYEGGVTKIKLEMVCVNPI